MIHQRAYICGLFTSNNVVGLTKQLTEWGWEKGNVSVKEAVKEGYYASFQNFMFSKSLSQGCYTFCRQVDKEIPIRNCSVHVSEIRLYILPLNVVIFSIEIEQHSDSVKELCSTMRLLRNCRRYKKLSDEWTQQVVRPLKDACQFLTSNPNASYIDFVENSDRMKTMKVIWSDEGFEELDAIRRKYLLYNLCTSDYKTSEDGTATDETQQYIIKKTRDYAVSIFKQWEALSLPDSFTVLYYDAMPEGVIVKQKSKKGETEEYDQWAWHFRLLYVYTLFQKCYLFKLNDSHFEILQNSGASKAPGFFQRVRQIISQQSTPLQQLIKEMNVFENRYVFYNISYNMFTMDLYNNMYKGLQVAQERREIYRLIKSEQKEADASSMNKLNKILLLLSLFTLFSAILDACQLFDSIVPFDWWLPHKVVGNILVSLLILTLFFYIIRQMIMGKDRQSSPFSNKKT